MDKPKPFRHARPRSEFLKRYNAMYGPTPFQQMQQQDQKQADGDVDFSADSVIISTPVPSRVPETYARGAVGPSVTIKADPVVVSGLPSTTHIRNTSKPLAKISANTVVLSGPATPPQSACDKRPATKPVSNVNYRGRLIDQILRQEDEDEARQAIVTRKHQETQDLLRKLSRSLSRSPPKMEDVPEELRAMYDTAETPTVPRQAPPPKAKTATQQPTTSKRIMSEPVHPKSALEAVITEVKEGKDTHHYGEETMASLENIIHPTVEQTNSTFDNDQTPEQEEPQERFLTQAEKDRRQEKLALEAMSKRLTSTSSSLKDANKGLRRIENRIEAGEAAQTQNLPPVEEKPEPPQAPPSSQPKNTTSSNQNFASTGNSSGVCTHCGHGQPSVWKALWTEFRMNFYNDGFTRLGWMFVAWCIWAVLECVLCILFCNDYCGPRLGFITLYFVLGPFFPWIVPYLEDWDTPNQMYG